jgi:hypothetical protein
LVDAWGNVAVQHMTHEQQRAIPNPVDSYQLLQKQVGYTTESVVDAMMPLSIIQDTNGFRIIPFPVILVTK